MDSFDRRRTLPMLFAVLMAGAVPLIGQTETVNEPLKISVGGPAPDFALPAPDGQTVWLSSLAGHTVLIDFYRGYY
jgi:cytochrome oxidase Cu insertion factor (SCO1/SenC/PrrC family)